MSLFVPPTAEAIRSSVPRTDGTVAVSGLEAAVEVFHDSLGVAHIRATSDADAFFAQGFVHAQDRLWHMDYDRRRAYGRWAEWAGEKGLAHDRLLRALRIADGVRADYDALLPETRAMLDAYAAGVNAYIASAASLPVEYTLLKTRPEQWQAWDGLAVFKVRHVTMGTWEAKAWRGRLLARFGPEVLAALYPETPTEQLLILPPGAVAEASYAAPLEALAALLDAIPGPGEDEAGSNSWALAGSRTTTGKPLVAGDPHRPPDVPNVYYQNHLAGATFDVVGLSFPGLPGFPHFGHNERVAWCVTHAMADTQDLFVEQFDPQDAGRYRWRDGWRVADVRPETIHVRGAADVSFQSAMTHHGPVVAGEPARGYGVALRYTALLPGNRGWDCLLPMLRSRSAAELEAAMQGWVDPANNFIMADVEGNIAYRTRGQVPVRHQANAWVPVPGWTGEHEWTGFVPFAEMPSQSNPATGFLVTANNRIVGPDYPHYLSHWYPADHRARRIVAQLESSAIHSPDHMATIHADVLSRPAEALRPILDRVTPRTRRGAEALATLKGWDGQVGADLAAPLIFNAMREEMIVAILRACLGDLAPLPYQTPGNGPSSLVVRLRQRLPGLIVSDDRRLLPDGGTWVGELSEALERAVLALSRQLGERQSLWRWGAVHQLRPAHPLCLVEPGLDSSLNPEGCEMDGDADTVQAAAYHPASGYTVTSTSVARYLFDLADWDRSRWIVPYGVSGHPGSPHYADQAPFWRSHELRPMLYSWDQVSAEAESVQVLAPGEQRAPS